VRYIAPYVFRVAIADCRIVSCDDGKVAFTYRRVGSNRFRKMTLYAMEFLRRFLQHVLPTGLQKVRHYGFLSPSSGTSLDAVRWLITLHNGGVFTLRAMLTAPPAEPPAPPSVSGVWWREVPAEPHSLSAGLRFELARFLKRVPHQDGLRSLATVQARSRCAPWSKSRASTARSGRFVPPRDMIASPHQATQLIPSGRDVFTGQ
jgi:hypothetical protein